MSIEQKINQQLNKYPALKRKAKRIYQRTMYTFSKKKSYEGEIIRLSSSRLPDFRLSDSRLSDFRCSDPLSMSDLISPSESLPAPLSLTHCYLQLLSYD